MDINFSDYENKILDQIAKELSDSAISDVSYDRADALRHCIAHYYFSVLNHKFNEAE